MYDTTKTRSIASPSQAGRNGWLGGESPDQGGRHRKDRWLTPRYLTDPLGEFDLDPAGAPGHDLAARTYLLENGEDGLVLPWQGRVWLNPPYGKFLTPFLERMAGHGHGTALLFARTETAAFHEHVWGAASGILFLRGRVRFLDAEGKAARANSGAPSCLVAYGEADAQALRSSGIAGHYVDLRAA